MLTVKDCQITVARVLGQGPDTLSADIYELINDAGETFTSLHRWTFLNQVTAELDLVTGQEFITLPADFTEILSIERGRKFGVRLTTMQVIIDLRSNVGAATSPQLFRGAIVWNNVAGAQPIPRVEIYPTPTANESDAITIHYRKDWQRISTDETILSIPDHLIPLYKRILVLFAENYHIQIEGRSIESDTELLRRSQMFKGAINVDAGTQSNLGPIQEGAPGKVRFSFLHHDRISGIVTSE